VFPNSSHPGRQSIRLKDYDYRQRGIYFVTICTGDRITYFDRPRPKAIAGQVWVSLPEHHRVTLDEWVVMPNHVHGLLVLVGDGPSADKPTAERTDVVGQFSPHMSNLGPRGSSLGAVVRAYKAAVSKIIRAGGQADFAWQRGYYEHVVRREAELDRIREYIRNNPAQWALDHDNPAYRGPSPSTTPWND
jgi:REP element-mobilizing transposase RayT